MIKYIFSIITIIIINLSSFAQIEHHVSWKYEYKDLGNNIVELIFKGKVDNNWDIYSINDELNPLTFTFEKSPNFNLQGSIKESWAPKKEYDDLMDATRHFYFNKCEFIQKIKVKNNKLVVKGSLDYQSCLSDGMCIMETEDFTINVELKKMKQ